MGSGSGAGLIRVSAVALSSPAGTAPNTTPLAGYDASGLTDSGLILLEARDYKTWTFSLVGDGEFTIYSATDGQLAYGTWQDSHNPQFLAFYGRAKRSYPASAFALLPGQADTSSGGATGNPLTPAAPVLQYNGALVGVRVVLTGPAVGTVNGAYVTVEAIP